MAAIDDSVLLVCPRCKVGLPPGALACAQCHTLVHGRRLDALAAQAREREAKGEVPQAREVWNTSLTLLPPDSKQAQWVREKLRSLETAVAIEADPAAKPAPAWVKKLGPLAPLALILLKSKGLLLAIFKLKFLLSFASFIWIYGVFYGWRFGLGFAVSLLIHEMGHYLDIRRRGLPAEMPLFLPGLGAFIKWTALGVTKRQIAEVSLAGPLAGFCAALGFYLLYLRTSDPLFMALARTGAVINVFNLTPVWMLDGGQATTALAQPQRIALLATVVFVWVLSGEGIFFLVALGCVWRLFTKDKPEKDDWAIWLYYFVLLIGFAVLLHLTPTKFPSQ